MHKMLFICLAVAAVVLAAIYIFKVPGQSLFSIGLVLLCPLMHLFMMKDMHGSEKDKKEKGACH